MVDASDCQLMTWQVHTPCGLPTGTQREFIELSRPRSPPSTWASVGERVFYRLVMWSQEVQADMPAP